MIDQVAITRPLLIRPADEQIGDVGPLQPSRRARRHQPSGAPTGDRDLDLLTCLDTPHELGCILAKLAKTDGGHARQSSTSATASGTIADPPAPALRPGEPRGASVQVRQNGRVQFSAELRDRVANGTITVSYRLWSRPQVKVGGVYRSGSARIEVDDIELLPFSSITSDDLALTGEPDLEALRRRAAHAGPIDDDTVLFRVQFHVVDPRGATCP